MVPRKRSKDAEALRNGTQAKLRAAVKAAEQFNAEAVETDERKRKYNAAANGSANGDAEPTPGGNRLCQDAAPDQGQHGLSIAFWAFCIRKILHC